AARTGGGPAAGVAPAAAARAPAAEVGHEQPERARVDPRDEPRDARRHRQLDRRSREVSIRALEEIARAAERCDHAREAIRRGARAERLFHDSLGGGAVTGEPAAYQELAGQGHRHGVEPLVAPTAGQYSDRLADFEGVADVATEHLAHVGQ